MALTRRSRRFSYDKSYMTEALKGKEPNISDLTRQVKEHKEIIKKQEARIRLLETKLNKMSTLLRQHHSKLISMNSDLLSTSTSIDNIKRQTKRARLK